MLNRPSLSDRDHKELAGKRVLVTGAGGFIGSHLTEELVRLGARTRAFVRYNSRNEWGLLELLPGDALREVEVLMGDLRDPEAVRRAIRATDVVFHLGALIAIPYSYINPRDFVDTNIVGTTNVLHACLDAGVTRLVQASTSEVYGTAITTPISEDHPLQGQSPYSASKIAADQLSLSYFRAFDLPVAILRPFNTYGPRQSTRAVIPTIISQAISGNIVRLGALHPTRDLTFVADTVRGFLLIATANNVIGEVINIGSGREISIEDLAALILRLTESEARVVLDPERVRPEKSEVDQLIADTKKAERLLGWRPTIDLKQGLARTIEWIRPQLGRYKVEQYNV